MGMGPECVNLSELSTGRLRVACLTPVLYSIRSTGLMNRPFSAPSAKPEPSSRGDFAGHDPAHRFTHLGNASHFAWLPRG
jgi:hypothetical protein